MSRKPVVYVLESQHAEGAAWVLVLDEHLEPITFKGRGSKAQALTLAQIVMRWLSPAWSAMRVRCGNEIVKTWTRKVGQSS